MPPMSVNVEVAKTGSENSLSLLRRFTKRVQGAGILPRVRGRRYFKRLPSFYNKKKSALAVIKRRKEVQELIKLGKMSETTRRR